MGSLQGNLSRKKTGYLPSLDGWRAIAILGVLMTHDTSWINGGTVKPAWQDVGGFGVDLFFAISGLLITTRILEEERICGRFDVKGFYIRRFFRIQPAAWAYLALLGVFMAAGILHEQWHFWVGAVFFYENFLWKGLAFIPACYFVGHFWSLAVEEHFYILLSLLMLSVRRWRLQVLLSAWFVLLVLQHIAAKHGILTDVSERRTYWQLPFLLLPSAFAVALQRQTVRHCAVRWLRPWVAFLLPIPFVVLERARAFQHHGSAALTSRAIIMAAAELFALVFFAVWVVATMLHPESWTTRLLEWAPLRWIGKISYSLYLWHVFFFFRTDPQTAVTQKFLVALSGRPAKYIAAFAVAALSYYLLERPLMRLGHRLAPPARPGRPELQVTASKNHPAIAEAPAPTV
jgi:peptidoglycan/LPS O-acetylase OafA/YrhL